MHVTFKFVGGFQSISGTGIMTMITSSPIPLREALKRITEELPTLKSVLFDPELDDPRPNSLILVNGREVSVLNGLDTILNDGDEVVLIPILHGGALKFRGTLHKT
ncbi:MAG: MoaD/ThiS family protein [Candidatus Bathyarchaeia archaeon]